MKPKAPLIPLTTKEILALPIFPQGDEDPKFNKRTPLPFHLTRKINGDREGIGEFNAFNPDKLLLDDSTLPDAIARAQRAAIRALWDSGITDLAELAEAVVLHEWVVARRLQECRLWTVARFQEWQKARKWKKPRRNAKVQHNHALFTGACA